MVGGSFSRDKILMYLGIPMLIGVPAAYRRARITKSLRERGIPPGAPDDQTIPPATAVAIIDELKGSLPKGHTNKMVAQETLQIFEGLNASPPGWLASIGLLFVYCTCLGMAAVFAGVFLVGQRGDFRALLANAPNQPQRSLVCNGSLAWRGEKAPGPAATAPVTLVAHFPRQADAARAVEGMTNRLPAVASIRTLGDSVLLTLPAGDDALRKQYFSELQARTKVVFVDSSNVSAVVSISWKLATAEEAKGMAEQLTGYLSSDLPASLIPPWHPNDRRTPEERAAHELARQTYVKSLSARWGGYDAPRMVALQKQISEARRRGDEAEVESLRKQTATLATELGRERLEKLKAGGDGPVDPAVIDLTVAMAASGTATNRDSMRRLRGDLVKRMGPVARGDGEIDPGADRFSTRAGMVSSEGRLLRLSFASFTRLSDGAPALLDWLCARGGSDFKYDIVAGTGLSSDEDP